MDISELVSRSAELGSILASAVVAYQLVLLKRQQIDEFLSGYNKRYDDIMRNIPLTVLLDGKRAAGVPVDHNPASETDDVVRRAIFDYMQLCEEQLTLLSLRKIIRVEILRGREIRSQNHGSRFPMKTRNTGRWLSNREQWESVADEWIEGMRQNFSNPIFRESFEDLKKRTSLRVNHPFNNLSCLVESL